MALTDGSVRKMRTIRTIRHCRQRWQQQAVDETSNSSDALQIRSIMSLKGKGTATRAVQLTLQSMH
jgi:hypothetical protein